MTIEPDTKDWTWVLERACPECGFDAAACDVDDLPAAIARQRRRVGGACSARPDVGDRPGRRPSGRRWSTPATCATCTASSTSGSG